MPAAHPLRTDLKPRGRDYVTILSLDGGGIRGLIPARVVEALERRTGMPACRLFDVIAGTSTGGIIALALTKPGEGGAKPRYSATDLVELYRSRGPEIFQRSLKSYLGNTRHQEALTPVLVTSYDTASASPYFFNSYRTAPPSDDYMMWQAVRATSAAPTFFPPFH